MAHTSAKDKMYSTHNSFSSGSASQDRMSQLIARMKANPRQARAAAMLERMEARRMGQAGRLSPQPSTSIGGGTTLAQARAQGAAKRARRMSRIIIVFVFLIIFALVALNSHHATNSSTTTATATSVPSSITPGSISTTIPTQPTTTTITVTNSSSISSTATGNTSTTMPARATTTITVTNSSSVSSTTSVQGATSCNGFNLSTSQVSALINATCSWTGGTMNVYEGAGDSGSLSFYIIGNSDNKTYVQSLSNTNYCYNLFASVYLPAQSYTIKMHTGRGGGGCGSAFVKLSTS